MSEYMQETIKELSSVGSVIFELKEKLEIVEANKKFWEIFLLTHEEYERTWKHKFDSFIFKDNYSVLLEKLKKLKNIGESFELKIKAQRKNGAIVYLFIRGYLIEKEVDYSKFYVEFFDVTFEKKMQEELDFYSEVHTLIQEVARESLFLYDEKNDVFRMFGSAKNDAKNEIIRYNYKERVKSLKTTFENEYYKKVYADWFEMALKEPRKGCFEIKTDATKNYTWQIVYYSSIAGEDGKVKQVIGRVVDIDKTKQKAQALEKEIRTDSMTKLLNKVGMEDYVKRAFYQRDKDDKFALIFIDINNFKDINKKMGVMFGDTVIINIANSIRKVFNNGELIGRLGSDDFAVFMQYSSEDEIQKKIEEINALLNSSYFGEFEDVCIKCYICVAYYGKDGETFEQLYNYARETTAMKKQLLEENKTKKASRDFMAREYDEELVSFALSVLYSSKDLESTIDLLLARIGTKCGLDIVEVLSSDKRLEYTKEISVWRKHASEDTSKKVFKGRFNWDNLSTRFDEKRMLCVDDVSKIEFSEPFNVDLVEMNNLTAYVVCRFADEEEDRIKYVVFGNVLKAREWTRYEKATFYEFTKILSVFIMLKDQREKDRARIKRLSQRDVVTELYNYDTFLRKLEKRAHEGCLNGVCAIVYCDIDNFSYINEAFGYSIGDDMLREFSKPFLKIWDSENFGCRLYSDYFIFFFTSKSKQTILNYIEQQMKLFIKAQEKKLSANDISTSVGVYFIDEQSFDVAVAIDNANLARKNVKGFKDSICGIYDSKLREKRIIEQTIVAELKNAIDGGYIEMFLQPKFNLKTKKIIGAEALARWRNPEGSLKYPDEFIPVLEKTGHIVDLDFFIYEQSLIYMNKWKNLGKKVVPISVNFSRVHVNNKNFVDKVTELAKKYDIDKQCIELEVTESSLLGNDSKMRECIAILRKRGFRVDIDDFGTGYSNFNMLMEIPVDVVKIDKSFIRDNCKTDRDKEYIKQMGTLIYVTQNEIIFEGVETEEQAQFLLDCGFKFAQGYLFEKPIPVSIFEEKYIF